MESMALKLGNPCPEAQICFGYFGRALSLGSWTSPGRRPKSSTIRPHRGSFYRCSSTVEAAHLALGLCHPTVRCACGPTSDVPFLTSSKDRRGNLDFRRFQLAQLLFDRSHLLADAPAFCNSLGQDALLFIGVSPSLLRCSPSLTKGLVCRPHSGLVALDPIALHASSLAVS